MFCLKWNNLKEHVINIFVTLRRDNEFTDVTVACDEDKQVEPTKSYILQLTHYFAMIKKEKKHYKHPLNLHEENKHVDLLAILDFIFLFVNPL